LFISFLEGRMFSRWIITNITSARGTVHCRKIPCWDQLMICGQQVDIAWSAAQLLEWQALYILYVLCIMIYICACAWACASERVWVRVSEWVSEWVSEYRTETKTSWLMTDPTSRQRGRPTATKTVNIKDMTRIWWWPPQGAQQQDGQTVSRNVTLTDLLLISLPSFLLPSRLRCQCSEAFIPVLGLNFDRNTGYPEFMYVCMYVCMYVVLLSLYSTVLDTPHREVWNMPAHAGRLGETVNWQGHLSAFWQ
jgi:hypothetical protein